MRATSRGPSTSSVGGNVAQDTKLGTYTVNRDCAGTLTLEVYNPAGILLRASTWAIVLTDKATEIRGTMTSLVLGNGLRLSPIMSMTATRMFAGQAARTCSSTPGTWGILVDGDVPSTDGAGARHGGRHDGL